MWARWTARPNVTVTFDANGGPYVPIRRPVQAGTRLGLPPGSSRAAHTFVGWFNTPEATGGRQYTADSTIEGNMTLWARWTAPTIGHINLTARIRHDGNAVTHNTVEQMRTRYNNATNLFNNIFNVSFNLGNDIALARTLNPDLKDGCAHGIICRIARPRWPGCGSDCDADHCKSGNRMIAMEQHSTIYTLRIVGYVICALDEVHNNPEVDHRSTGGLGVPGGRDSIASSHYSRTGHSASAVLEWIIQHELAHNLGARDVRCAPEQHCTMRDISEAGELCRICRNDIWTHLLARYG